MDAELKTKWVKALRSGDYEQGKNSLRKNDKYCCLGVLCEIQGADFGEIKEKYGTLSLCYSPPQFLGGIPRNIRSKIVSMNDSGASFSEIADYIEKHL